MRSVGGIVVAVLLAAPGVCQDAARLLAEAQRRAQSKSVRYYGTLQTFSQSGKSSEKGWTFERLGRRGESRILIRFLSPGDVKGMAVLIVNHPNRPSDRWLWTPATRRMRSLTTRDIGLLGVDFSFEDLEEPELGQFAGKLLPDSRAGGAACWKIELRPKPGALSPYRYSHLWLRKDNYAVAQVENFGEKGLLRQIVNGDLRNVEGIWTPHAVDVLQPARGSGTLLRVEKAEYNVALEDAAFTVEAVSAAGREPQAAAQACSFFVQPQSAGAPAAGFSGTILVTTQPGCSWTASPDVAWIAILSGAGRGSTTGAVAFRVEANPGSEARKGSIRIGWRRVELTQKGGTR